MITSKACKKLLNVLKSTRKANILPDTFLLSSYSMSFLFCFVKFDQLNTEELFMCNDSSDFFNLSGYLKLPPTRNQQTHISLFFEYGFWKLGKVKLYFWSLGLYQDHKNARFTFLSQTFRLSQYNALYYLLGIIRSLLNN